MSKEKRLADVNELLKEINRTVDIMERRGEKLSIRNVIMCVKNAPTVDAVEVVHGRWEYGKWEQGHWVKGNERCRCSVCHRDFAVDNLNIWHGCPQCLAKMDGGNEDG